MRYCVISTPMIYDQATKAVCGVIGVPECGDAHASVSVSGRRGRVGVGARSNCGSWQSGPNRQTFRIPVEWNAEVTFATSSLPGHRGVIKSRTRSYLFNLLHSFWQFIQYERPGRYTGAFTLLNQGCQGVSCSGDEQGQRSSTCTACKVGDRFEISDRN